MKRDVGALIRYLAERGPMPHVFGDKANDCISFLAGAVKAQTGCNPISRLRWRNERDALRLLKSEGGAEAALDARFERIAPAQAHRGDIAGVPHPQFGLHPMLVEGLTLVAPGQRGLKRCPRSAMTAAWDVTRPKSGGSRSRQPSRERGE